MFEISSTQDGLRVTWNEESLLDYHFKTGGPRTYWHPLQLPGSPALTMDRPADHIHHQGMWVAWKKVNGVNFWEQPKPNADPTGFGRIVHKKLLSSAANSRKAQFATENAWIDWQDIVLMNETRETLVYTPHENYLVIDISLRFSPNDRDIKLDLNRGEPGKGGLFYSGLTIRFHNDLTPARLLDADGRNEALDIYGSSSRWCGLSGQHKQNGEIYGATILDHPQNPRYPTPWWVRNAENYALIQPCLCYYEPLEISAGDPLQLRYSVILHRGHVSSELIEYAVSSITEK